MIKKRELSQPRAFVAMILARGNELANAIAEQCMMISESRERDQRFNLAINRPRVRTLSHAHAGNALHRAIAACTQEPGFVLSRAIACLTPPLCLASLIF